MSDSEQQQAASAQASTIRVITETRNLKIRLSHQETIKLLRVKRGTIG